MLTTSAEKLEGTTVKLTITVPAEEVDKAIADAYSRLSAKLRIPGFRKGKAPRPVVDNYLGHDNVLAEATEGVVNDTYPRAIDAEGLRPVESPEMDALDTVTEGQPYTYEVEVVTRPKLTLESYENIKVEVPSPKANDLDIEAQIEELRERFASLEPVEDRGVAANDFVLISFVGLVDGVEYEGNRVDKYLYEMNRGLMPQEFDEALMGVEAGGETHVEFPIPDNSTNQEFVGKTASFDITVHEIKRKKLPEVDDAFAGEMGFDTIEQMREDLRTRLDMQKLFTYTRAKEKAAREELASRTPGDIPEGMVRSRAQSLLQDFERRIEDQGMTLASYSEATGLTSETLDAELAADAIQQIREDLALESLFEQLGMEVTDEDLDAEFKEMAEASKTSVEETRKRWEDLGLMAIVAEGVIHRKAVGWLMENVEEVVVEPETAAAAEPSEEGTKKTTRKRASSKKKAEAATEEAAAEPVAESADSTEE